MTRWNRTWRDVDGERIEGTWQHVFCREGDTHVLRDLFVYADGMVGCWSLVPFDEFAEDIASYTPELPDGGTASAHDLGWWTFAEPHTWLTAERLLADVRDEIDRLSRRPDSTARCHLALEAFRAQPDGTTRAALRAAYLAIPEHRRQFALGDMDHHDWPLQAIAYGPGGTFVLRDEEHAITNEVHERALAYFAGRDERVRRYEEENPPEPIEPSVPIDLVVFPNGWPDDAGVLVLRNSFPCRVTVGEQTYGSVTEAWKAVEATVAPQARTAVMARLLRLKFAQHPELAETLKETGTARLIYSDLSTFWGHGRNWMGRLLELVRAELFVHNDEPVHQHESSTGIIDQKGIDH
ncbi:NADAR family protein [Lentzea sp. NPDC058450]|uniref:NADAR family protein n=1 Tax=Lentzea sp. NPDC058450 TaxID=3346505 RepID=UPI00365802BB